MTNDGPEIRAVYERAMATVKAIFFELGIGQLFKSKNNLKIDRFKCLNMLRHTLGFIKFRGQL